MSTTPESTDFDARRVEVFKTTKGCEDRLLKDLIHRLLNAEIDADAALLAAARSLRDRVDSLIATVEAGSIDYRSDEVSEMAGVVNRLCGEREQAILNAVYGRRVVGLPGWADGRP